MISKDVIIKNMEEVLLSSANGDKIKKIIIYGSMARGDNTSESDYDCIVIVEKIENEITDAIDEFAAEMLIRFGVVFSIIPVEENSFSEKIYNPLFININREGMVLWKKTA